MLGAGLAIARVLPALRELGWRPSVILPEDGPLIEALADVEILVADPARPIGVSVRGWRRPPGARRRLSQTRRYFANLRRGLVRQQPDVVHVNSLHALPEGFTARQLSLPIVLHAHEIPPPSVKRDLAIRGASALADVVVPVSDTVKAMYRPAMRSSRLMTVYNGVELRPLLDTHRVPVVGTVGSICERKGTDVLLQAVGLVSAVRDDIAFEHVGPAVASNDPAFARRLERLAVDAGQLTFLGYGDVDRALPRWGIFVLPSRQEAFPLATLEAMAAGLPVIASDVGGVSEQILDRQSGVLVPPGDPKALARAILDLAADPSLRRRLGESARKRVAELFGYERQASGLDAAYMAALRRHGRQLS
jgi:glycosyltransferase involved in cell wall biosynthesis